MKTALTRISVVLVVVLFLFGFGCANLVGPEGPAGPQGDEGPAGTDGTDGTDGVPSPEMYAAIEQTLEAYFAGWNAFVEYDEFDPAGIEVFGDVFAYPVFGVVTYLSEVEPEEYPDAESLGDELALNYGYYRSEESESVAVEMLAFWSGSTQSNGSFAQQSSKQWFWVTAIIEVTHIGEGDLFTERETVEFSLSFGSDGVARIRYFPIFAVPN